KNTFWSTGFSLLSSTSPNPSVSIKPKNRGAMLVMLFCLIASFAQAVPDTMARDQILEIANEHLKLHWYCDTYNIYSGVTNATCPYSTPAYQDGLSYKWGGYDTRDSFYSSVIVGHGWAGDTNSAAIVSGTYGDDCSGFASRTWRSGHYTTDSNPEQ